MIGAGQLIGNYRILSKIGTGGMGAVFLAEHPLIGKRVALKVIHRELAGNREVVQRFFQEARAVNTIGNEHIVEIHDFGVSPEGDHFYIMEYLDGRTLASVLSRESTLDVMRSLHIGAQIAKALGAAHAAGVIHRDLKPDNIMLMSRLGDPDFVKVLDFGLAKMFAENASSVKTAAGVLLGTPQYMSPEACESKRDIDHRTDVYALGVLLFQMMTGVLPFDGDSMGEVLVKQVTALPPAPRGLNPAIPPSVEQILLRCLAKPPDARFPSMFALRDALLDPEAYLRASPPIAPARSVAPGEAKGDARTVLMNPDASQRARQAMAGPPSGHAPTVMLDERAAGAPQKRFPTGAIVPGLLPPAEPINHTMRIATPLGYSSRPPRKMWPIVVVLGLVLGLGGGTAAVSWCGPGAQSDAPRDDDAATAPAGGGASGAAPEAGSATPAGTAGASGSGGSAGSAATAATANGSGSVSSAGSAGSAGSAASANSGGNGGSTGSTGGVGGVGGVGSGSIGSAGSAVGAAGGSNAPALAKLTIESVPRGASVYSSEGELLGKTPLKLEWPISQDPMTFELRLAGYRRRTKEIVVGGNTTVRIELEALPRLPPPPSGTSPKGGGDPDSGLMRPE